MLPSLKTLYSRLSADISEFADDGDTIETPNGPLTYIDRGSNVLAVAHLDYVLWQTPKTLNDHTVQCGQLDDRLGAWLALDVMPAIGANVDVLLTDNEESGMSTAQFFNPPKRYNWIMQFDRAGSDVVTYGYDSLDWIAALSDRWSIGCGSYSDISELESLGASAVNIGCGYHLQHTSQCYANLRETEASVRRLSSFYHQHQFCRFDHTPHDDGVWWADWTDDTTLNDDGLWVVCHCGHDYMLGHDDYDDGQCPTCGLDSFYAYPLT